MKNLQEVASILSEKTILITGGTGSFGRAFIHSILKNVSIEQFPHIIVYSRDETKQQELQNFINKINKQLHIIFIIGDVRDSLRLEQIFARFAPDYVLHAAAMKHVDICEANQDEAIKTNIYGTQNVVFLCQKYNVKTAINLSADKAVHPHGVYGITKHLAEKIFAHGNGMRTRFISLRYSNVLGSRGSVFETFYKTLENNGTINVYSDMNRLVLTQNEVIELVLLALIDTSIEGILIKKSPVISIKDLALAMKEIIGKGFITYKQTLRPGEKEDALLYTAEEGSHLFPLDDSIFLIHPTRFNDCAISPYGTHNAQKLSFDEIKKLLTKVLEEMR